MDGAASEAVRGLKAEKDSDLTQIWDALARRFGFLDEPERAMRRFDVRKQQDGESLAVFEQSLRILFREAWPKTDVKSSDADSLLRRRFVDGVADLELQKYLRIHAASDDFASTVSKACHFVDASELSRTPKKPAIRGASPSVNFQAIIDGVKEVVETALHDQGRQAEVHNCQISNPNSKSASKTKKPQARPPSPAASDASSVGSSRVSSSGRMVSFEDQSSDPSNGRGYGSSDRGRWTNRQSGSQGNGDRHGRRATTAVPVVKGTRVRSPLPRATQIRRSVEVAHVIRHRSLNVNGGQGKGAPAIVPRPRETTENGDKSGGRHPGIVTLGRPDNSSPLRVNVVGVLVPQVRSPQVLSMLLLIVM